jgi:hypothetical protein
MADGFSVDLDALQNAAEGVTDTLNAMATKRVKDVDAAKSAFGHDKLGGTVGDFCETFDHVTKVQNAQRGLVNRITQLQRQIGDTRISDTGRAAPHPS